MRKKDDFSMANSDFPLIRVFSSEQSNKWEFQLLVHLKSGEKSFPSPCPATWKGSLSCTRARQKNYTVNSYLEMFM